MTVYEQIGKQTTAGVPLDLACNLGLCTVRWQAARRAVKFIGYLRR